MEQFRPGIHLTQPYSLGEACNRMHQKVLGTKVELYMYWSGIRVAMTIPVIQPAAQEGPGYSMEQQEKEALTLDMNALMTRWMKLYINLNVVMSTDQNVRDVLEGMKFEAARFNEFMMGFFDTMGAEPEIEG